MTQKQLTTISFSHRNTGLDDRDALAFKPSEIAAFVGLCRQQWACEAAVLTTCNRTEFYLYGLPLADPWQALQPMVSELRGIAAADLPRPEVAFDEAGARHLFRVAASLESLALGENQILAQIKNVHDQILDGEGKSPTLDRLFQYAIRVGKQVRTETSLCEGALSISSAAVDLAAKIFGKFAGREILIVGAGETAEMAAMHFNSSGADTFIVLNRTRERGAKVAERFQTAYRPLEELEDACASADIAVFATGAQDYLLTRAQMKVVMKRRNHRPIFLIDISNPRNVDPDADRLDSVFLYNIDDLEQVVLANLDSRKGEIPAARAIIDHMVKEWKTWEQSMEVTPTIASLARFFEEVRAQELSRHHNSISESERAMLDNFSRGLIKKLLHNPIMYLRGAVDDESLRAEDLDLVWSLYNLEKAKETSDET